MVTRLQPKHYIEKCPHMEIIDNRDLGCVFPAMALDRSTRIPYSPFCRLAFHKDSRWFLSQALNQIVIIKKPKLLEITEMRRI